MPQDTMSELVLCREELYKALRELTTCKDALIACRMEIEELKLKLSAR
jgi:predicted  nucleic acid-binding Zn-ribbon protein